MAELYKIPNVYTDFRELLKRDDIEAVDVCLHNNLHMPVTVAALEAGKHVYCEKPMAGAYVRRPDDARRRAQATGPAALHPAQHALLQRRPRPRAP